MLSRHLTTLSYIHCSVDVAQFSELERCDPHSEVDDEVDVDVDGEVEDGCSHSHSLEPDSPAIGPEVLCTLDKGAAEAVRGRLAVEEQV